MAVIESAWKNHPGYAIDLVPFPGTARAWLGDLLLAESTAALRVIETDHVERLYFPQEDVRLDLFEENDHHTICPFKGQADYWTLIRSDPPVEDVFWTYRELFDEVAGLQNHLGVYHEKVRVELETRWPDDPRAVTASPFPVWGDQADLLRLIDAQPEGPDHFVAPGYHERSRNVVEGGQLLAQAIVAAAKTVPEQRVISAHAVFPKAASFDDPIDLSVELLRRGRSFSTVSVRSSQRGALVCPTTVLMDAGAPEVLRAVGPMPEVPGPYESEPYEMRVTGRDLRIVDGAYSPDPDRVGPPEIHAWMRFRNSPDERYLRQALVAQATSHWTIAAAMRPHPGLGEAQAHQTLSTGIMAVTIRFHDDAPVDEWFLYANRASWAGHGLAQGEGTVSTQDGTLVASYSVQAMIRPFDTPPGARGLDGAQRNVSVALPRPPRLSPPLSDQAIFDDDLSDSTLRGDFSGQSYEQAVMVRSHLVQAQFTGAVLAQLRLTDVLIEGCDFSGTDLDEASATRVEFRDCRMSGAVFTRTLLRDVRFTGCRLDDANFRMAETRAVVFEDADLRRGDFAMANLEGTRFFDCDLTGATFTKVKAPGVRFHGSTLLDLKGANYLGGAVIESGQILPVALSVLSALQIGVDDEREPAEAPAPRRR